MRNRPSVPRTDGPVITFSADCDNLSYQHVLRRLEGYAVTINGEATVEVKAVTDYGIRAVDYMTGEAMFFPWRKVWWIEYN